MRATVLLLNLLLTLICAGGVRAKPRPALDGLPVTVAVESGTLAGRLRDGVQAFRGIPYAAARVRAPRWRPSQPRPPGFS